MREVPSKADLRRIPRPAELVVIPNYQKELYGIPPFISSISFPMGNGNAKVSKPHTMTSRISRAFNMAEDLLQRVQHGVGIVLEGTSFNHPTFSAQQNYVAGYSIIGGRATLTSCFAAVTSRRCATPTTSTLSTPRRSTRGWATSTPT